MQPFRVSRGGPESWSAEIAVQLKTGQDTCTGMFIVQSGLPAKPLPAMIVITHFGRSQKFIGRMSHHISSHLLAGPSINHIELLRKLLYVYRLRADDAWMSWTRVSVGS